MVDFQSKYQLANGKYLDMDEFVKLGGWSSDYFNFVVATDQSSFWRWMFTTADMAYDATDRAVDEIVQRFETEEMYRKEDPTGYVGETYDEIYESVVDTASKDFALAEVGRMEDDEIAAYWTAAGCYDFSHTTSPYWTRNGSSYPNNFDLDDDWYQRENAISGLMAPFLLQFSRDMFFSMMNVRNQVNETRRWSSF